MDFLALVRYSKMVQYGLLAILAGIGMAGYGLLHQLPAEADLQTVSGVVEKATKVTTRRRRGGESVSYKLEVKGEKGEQLELTIPAAEISEIQVRAVLNAKAMSAKYDGESDVYVLTADGRSVITYATTRARRASTDTSLAEFGGIAAGAGVVLALIGFLWNRRKLAHAGGQAT